MTSCPEGSLPSDKINGTSESSPMLVLTSLLWSHAYCLGKKGMQIFILHLPITLSFALPLTKLSKKMIV